MIQSLKNLTLRNKILVIGLLLLIIAGALAFFRIINNTKQSEPVLETHTPVTLMSIQNLAQGDTNLSITGTVRSKSEATLQVEIPGRLTGVYRKVGSWVRNGALIAEVENSAQKAQVTQALGALQAAKARAKSTQAQHRKIIGGTRSEQLTILQAALTSAKDSNKTAQSNARNALLSTYATVNQSIIHGTDTLFRNPSRYNPKIDFTLSDSDLRNQLSAERIDIRYILERHEQVLTNLSEADINPEIAQTITELRKIKAFYDTLLVAIDKAVLPDATSAGYASIVGPARSAMIGQISTLTAIQNAITRSTNAIDIAKANNEQGATGAQQEDIDSSAAQVGAANASITTALGSYQAALANLEKTRVRAPISGTLGSFSARSGDFVGTASLGTIIGTGGNEVIFSIPSQDAGRVKKGTDILVATTLRGTVTSVSKSVSGISKQLEVRADILNSKHLTNGENITVQILSDTTKDTQKSALLLPLNTIKFTADNAYVFTVLEIATSTDARNTITALPVTLGTVEGARVTVSGADISANTVIVTDARGLQDGQSVTLLKSLK